MVDIWEKNPPPGRKEAAPFTNTDKKRVGQKFWRASLISFKKKLGLGGKNGSTKNFFAGVKKNHTPHFGIFSTSLRKILPLVQGIKKNQEQAQFKGLGEEATLSN